MNGYANDSIRQQLGGKKNSFGQFDIELPLTPAEERMLQDQKAYEIRKLTEQSPESRRQLGQEEFERLEQAAQLRQEKANLQQRLDELQDSANTPLSQRALLKIGEAHDQLDRVDIQAENASVTLTVPNLGPLKDKALLSVGVDRNGITHSEGISDLSTQGLGKGKAKLNDNLTGKIDGADTPSLEANYNIPLSGAAELNIKQDLSKVGEKTSIQLKAGLGNYISVQGTISVTIDDEKINQKK